MVKPDATRDYYADLGCQTGADPADVKKAFKKLALKYHPDRNIGNEVEANAKFQDIQAAHEILTDPEKRAKYDAERIKVGKLGGFGRPKPTSAGGAPDVPPRSPYMAPNMGSNFPPPPRRTQPQPQPGQYAGPKSAGNGMPKPAAAAAAGAAGGANRYSQYTFDRGQPQSWRKMAQEQQANFNTWEQMKKHGPAPNERAKPPYPPPPRRTAKNTQYADGKTGKQRGGWDTDTPPRPVPDPRKQFPEVPPRAGVNRANTMRSPRKPGFFPGSGSGGEPPAPNTSAYHGVQQGQKPRASRPQSYHPPPPPTSAASEKYRPESMQPPPSATSHADDAFSGDRLSTPYATTGGEKTYFNSEHVHRSSSQAPNLHAGWNQSARTSPKSPAPTNGHTRHRSASPSFRPSFVVDDEDFTSSSSSFSSDVEEERIDRTKLTPKRPSRYATRASPATATPHPDYPNVTVEEEFSPTGPRVTKRSTWGEEPQTSSDGNTRVYPASQPSSRKGSTSDAPQGFAQSRANKPHAQPPPSPLGSQPPWEAGVTGKPLEKSRSWHEKFGSTKDGNNRFERPSRPGTGDTDGQQPGYGFRHIPFSAASTAFYTDPFTPVFPNANPSAASAPFRNERWPYWAVPSSVSPIQSARSTSDGSFKTTMESKMESLAGSEADYSKYRFNMPNDSSSTSPARDSSTENVKTKWTAEDWQGKFDNPHDFLGPQKEASRTAPRGRSPPKRNVQNVFTRPKSGEPGSTANSTAPPTATFPVPAQEPGEVKFSKEEWEERFKKGSNWASSSSINSSGVNKQRTKTPRKNSFAARRPFVPPKPAAFAIVDDEASRSVSTSSSISAMDIDPKESPPPAHPQTDIRPGADPIFAQINTAVPSSTAAESSVPEEDDDTINLKNLKESAPFAPPKPGLEDMDPLRDSLHQPGPAASIPTLNVSASKIELPKVPTAPLAPDLDTLTQPQWSQYKKAFAQYILKWNQYNARMNNHFRARLEVHESLPPDLFLPSGNKAFQEYQVGIDQDFRVRAHWERSCEMHRDAVAGLARLRAVAARDGLNEDE